jgi:hypothetical protein
VEQGLSCTKHIAPVPDSVVLTAAPGSTRTNATLIVKLGHGKRKAAASPDANLDPKHAAKRPATTIKQEASERPYVYRPQPSRDDATLEGWIRDGQNRKLSQHYLSVHTC